MKKKKKKQENIDEVIQIEEKEIKNLKHYINNEEFCSAMVEWKKEVRAAEACDDPRPPVTNYIAECFLKIAEHLSYRPNFINYPFREDMVGDGIENCLLYAHNFDPNKSSNPFSYFTQIIYYAFLRRIEREKKQAYVKFKLTEEMDDGTLHKWFKENYFDKTNQREALSEHFSISERDIEKYEPKKRKKRKSTK